jgi:hypothetical protein
VEKVARKLGIFFNFSKVNNRPIGEKWPNLVTLIRRLTARFASEATLDSITAALIVEQNKGNFC